MADDRYERPIRSAEKIGREPEEERGALDEEFEELDEPEETDEDLLETDEEMDE